MLQTLNMFRLQQHIAICNIKSRYMNRKTPSLTEVAGLNLNKTTATGVPGSIITSGTRQRQGVRHIDRLVEAVLWRAMEAPLVEVQRQVILPLTQTLIHSSSSEKKQSTKYIAGTHHGHGHRC